MTRRLSHTTMLRQLKKATITTRGTPRQRMLNGEWAEYRYALIGLQEEAAERFAKLLKPK